MKLFNQLHVLYCPLAFHCHAFKRAQWKRNSLEDHLPFTQKGFHICKCYTHKQYISKCYTCDYIYQDHHLQMSIWVHLTDLDIFVFFKYFSQISQNSRQSFCERCETISHLFKCEIDIIYTLFMHLIYSSYRKKAFNQTTPLWKTTECVQIWHLNKVKSIPYIYNLLCKYPN